MEPKFSLKGGLLYYKDKLFITNDKPFKLKLLELFNWHKLIKKVKEFIRNCDISQRVKHENHLLGGLLQPLDIPFRPWSYILMDFVEGLPISHGFNCL